MVETASYILKVATAVGIYLWSPAHLRKLLRKARKQLAEILQQVEKCPTWPSYLLYNMIVLMGKPQGGTRPIALMPMLYRIWTKIRKPYKNGKEQMLAHGMQL
eukprot:12082804-Karenia_brevis.AAC.1